LVRIFARQSRWVVLLLAVAVVVGWLSHASEPDRAVESVTALARALRVEPGEDRAARRARIQQSVAEHVAPAAQVEVPDLPPGDLAVLAARLGDRFDEARIELEQPNVAIDGSGRQAELRARALLSGRSAASGLLSDVRELRVLLRQVGGRWQVTALEATGPSHVEPEPRP
jgi:hypothetical protein